MYEIRDELGNVLDAPATVPLAEQALEELCAQAHAQAVANGEGADDLWVRLRVVDAHGQTVMFRYYNPDPGKPYVPLNRENL
ncbi:hypothetical protein DQ384_05220 [Sphaerisporangium album]|uniref:Uncharacterized protein n=1 Tax=Sphaerisporangium album TaxID=509200 RepID=A0A367FNX8_9ACTN|nr:hypothetical protein [Sphaerisporangium album]RCG31944.1 hypothetical protein DQ384_05220 [Sphaerisporangium album]